MDEFTQTSDPSVYAIGDCSNHPSKLYQRRVRLESVQNAVDQAKTTAKSICGDPEIYDQAPWFWSDQYDVKLQIAGLNSGYDQVITRDGEQTGSTSFWYYREGKLLAVDALNFPKAYMVGKRIIEAGKSVGSDLVADPVVDIKDLMNAAK